MKASASTNSSQHITPKKKVFDVLSTDDVAHSILKSLAAHQLEVTADEMKRLTKRLVQQCKSLDASCSVELGSTTQTENPINLKKQSNQIFMRNLVCASDKLTGKSV